eukprot:s1028_g12.t1
MAHGCLEGRFIARFAKDSARAYLRIMAPTAVQYEDSSQAGPRTLYDKIWADHLVNEADGTSLIYIDRHLVHEVTSPQAFEGLRLSNREVRRTDCTLATVDHNIPTSSRKNFKELSSYRPALRPTSTCAQDTKSFIEEADSRQQVVTLEDNVQAFGLTYFGMEDKRQGIVHVIGPEQGFTLPGTTVVCGDSHTSTHGAFGALAFGIGTSEVEHVLATQTLLMNKAKNMRVKVSGKLAEGVTSKDVILHIIGVIGTAGGTGSVIEFCGDVFENMSMEARMSVCNMTIEAGARAGMVAPDDTTFSYLKGRPLCPKGKDWDKAVEYWKSLRTDKGAKFDKEINIDAADIAPTVTWGTSPEDVVAITGTVPDPKEAKDETKRTLLSVGGKCVFRTGMQRALQYMGLEPGTNMQDISIQKVFIGSCTNSRIEDMRSVAAVVKGRKAGLQAVGPPECLPALHAFAHVFLMAVTSLDSFRLKDPLDWTPSEVADFLASILPGHPCLDCFTYTSGYVLCSLEKDDLRRQAKNNEAANVIWTELASRRKGAQATGTKAVVQRGGVDPRSMFTLYVKLARQGSALELEVAPTDNVAYLKAQIAVHEGTPPESQRLVVAGATMQDERSLTSYGLHHGDSVLLVPCLRDQVRQRPACFAPRGLLALPGSKAWSPSSRAPFLPVLFADVSRNFPISLEFTTVADCEAFAEAARYAPPWLEILQRTW